MSIEKKRGLGILALVFALVLITNVCAAVYFSQPKPYYNYGDVIELNVSVDSIKESPLKIKLVCDGSSADIFNGPVIDSIRIPITSPWVKDLTGDCYFSGEYAGDTRKTNSNFKISKKLEILLDVESFFAKPLEEVKISGTAKKLNGAGSNGEVVIEIPFSGAVQKTGEVNNSDSSNSSLNTPVSGEKFYGAVSDGVFSVSFILPEKIAAGDYRISMDVSEKSDSGEKINQGSASASLKINQILTSIDVAISNQNFNPGTNLSIKPILLDQTGNPMTDQVSIALLDSEKNKIFERVINSGETADYSIPSGLASGYYGADISVGDMKISKTFFINEKAIVSFVIRNDSLIIKNIGNIPYKKDVQIELNGRPFVKRVDLNVGESKEFKLTGISGNYDVKVSDGESEFLQPGVALTGNAVNVKDSGGFYSVLYTPIFWTFLILILLIALLILARLVIKKRSVAYPSERKHLSLKNIIGKKHEIKEEKPEEKKHLISAFRKIVVPTQAEQSMVVGGERNRVAVIVLKIKEKISHETKAELEKIIEPIYARKGAVHEHGDSVIGIFSPLATKNPNNEADAARAAEQILSGLNEHNKKFIEKIKFGIGINSGDILNEIKEGKLKFTAFGNTIILAKKLAEISHERVLISKEAYERGISEIKAEKVRVSGIETYEVKKVVNHEQSKKFIQEFLKRNQMKPAAQKDYASNPYQSQEHSQSHQSSSQNHTQNHHNFEHKNSEHK
ncbi:MAG: adenylate/guanylate cyclase domain-containing protein [Nanoarchaeota archaeon]